MYYQQLDYIADLYIPILALLSLGSVLLQVRPSWRSVGRPAARLGLLLALIFSVYLLMFTDLHFSLWLKMDGLDYSTHTALSLVLIIFLVEAHRAYKILLIGSFISYLILMLFQRYHSVADIVVTALVIMVLSVGIFWGYRKVCNRVFTN